MGSTLGSPRACGTSAASRVLPTSRDVRRRASQQPVLVGVDHQLHPVAEPELGEDPGDVRLHGGLREVLDRRDLGVGEAGRGAQQDLPLARRELGRTPRPGRARGVRNRSSRVRVAPAATTWLPSATARTAASSSSGRASLSTNPLAPASIAETAASSRSKVVSTRTRGASSPRRVDQPPGRGHAVDPGHADVHDDDVGTCVGHQRGHLVAVLGLPDHLEVRLASRAPSRCRPGTWPGRRPARPGRSRDRLRERGAHRPGPVGGAGGEACRRPGPPARACRPRRDRSRGRRRSHGPGCARRDGSRRASPPRPRPGGPGRRA